MRLILFRSMAAGVIALVSVLWVYPASLPAQQQFMVIVGLLFALMLLIQTVLSFSSVSERSQLTLQYASDAVLASLLIFSTDGISSPFSFLLGLIIIASGAHALRLLPLAISILACSGYLAAVYGETWLARASSLNTQQALHVLLQVSALMLVGGVMAYISRRHATLRVKQEIAVSQHRKLKDLHDNIMAEMREGVIVLDRNLQVSDMNKAARALLGRQSVKELLAYPALENFFWQQQVASFQCEYERDAQTLLVAVRPLSREVDATWLLTLVDITDVRQLQLQLVQQEKMAALGQMAAMLAHEIRNPIQTMAQCLEIMRKTEESSASVQEILHDEMLRLKRLVTMMLDYSRPMQPCSTPTFMPEVMKSSINQVDVNLREMVNWTCQADELVIDADHFRLVMDNLLSNALANRKPDSMVDINLNWQGDGWRLTVSNEGVINAALMDKLFEPFVSGKSSGIGLGLATVKQICALNGWQVDVESPDGRTCFQVQASNQPDISFVEPDQSRERVNG